MMEKKRIVQIMFGLYVMYGFMMFKVFYFKIYIDLKN